LKTLFQADVNASMKNLPSSLLRLSMWSSSKMMVAMISAASDSFSGEKEGSGYSRVVYKGILFLTKKEAALGFVVGFRDGQWARKWVLTRSEKDDRPGWGPGWVRRVGGVPEGITVMAMMRPGVGAAQIPRR
jgi:hypothetical protein